jgi:CBS domain-containing protein
MNWASGIQEVRAIMASILFLALGFVAIWVTSNVLVIEGDAVYVSLLFAPILVYVILSGRLKEIRAPGGLEAKFADAAERVVDPAAATIEAAMEPNEMAILAKATLSELKRALPRIDESKPITLTITLDSRMHYDQWALLEYVRTLSQFRSFKFVVILDREGRFVAYMPSWAMRQIVERDALGSEFVEALNQDRVNELRRYPGVVTQTISTSATNIEAIQEMTNQNLEALVVVDDDRRLRGVVEREQVLSKLLLALAG